MRVKETVTQAQFMANTHNAKSGQELAQAMLAKQGWDELHFVNSEHTGGNTWVYEFDGIPPKGHFEDDFKTLEAEWLCDEIVELMTRRIQHGFPGQTRKRINGKDRTAPEQRAEKDDVLEALERAHFTILNSDIKHIAVGGKKF